MKMLKYSLFLLAPLSQLSAAVHTFEGLVNDAPLTTAEAGWSLSESNPASGPLAYVGPLNGSTAGGLGGELGTPTGDSVKLTMTSSLSSSYATVGFDMLIKDSTNDYPGRDVFGFSIANGSGASIVQLQFLPVAQSSNPEGGDTAQWEVAYTAGAGALTYTNIVLNEQALYFMNVAFAGSSFTLTLGNTLGSASFSGTIAGFDGAVNGIGNLAFTWDKPTPTVEFGDNSILFDNINVAATAVPEPSAMLLSGLASVLLIVRRRRN